MGGADIYLSVRTKRAGDLKGEANSPGHEKEIVAHGFQFGVSASSAIGSGQATARRQYKHLVVMKRLDSASTSLMSALATNDEIKELKLALRKPGDGQDDFFTITLTGARVVGVDLDCDASGEAVERATFAFTKIDVEYRVQSSAGILGASSTFSDELLAS
ncbi:MAG: type VI secretion system tube protein Hcp [Caldimonas sp.]